jgi:hypothetical protein
VSLNVGQTQQVFTVQILGVGLLDMRRRAWMWNSQGTDLPWVSECANVEYKLKFDYQIRDSAFNQKHLKKQNIFFKQLLLSDEFGLRFVLCQFNVEIYTFLATVNRLNKIQRGDDMIFQTSQNQCGSGAAINSKFFAWHCIYKRKARKICFLKRYNL